MCVLRFVRFVAFFKTAIIRTFWWEETFLTVEIVIYQGPRYYVMHVISECKTSGVNAIIATVTIIGFWN